MEKRDKVRFFFKFIKWFIIIFVGFLYWDEYQHLKYSDPLLAILMLIGVVAFVVAFVDWTGDN